jgi:hypothetical protein
MKALMLLVIFNFVENLLDEEIQERLHLLTDIGKTPLPSKNAHQHGICISASQCQDPFQHQETSQWLKQFQKLLKQPQKHPQQHAVQSLHMEMIHRNNIFGPCGVGVMVSEQISAAIRFSPVLILRLCGYQTLGY